MPAWEDTLSALVRERGPALVGYAYLLCGDRRQAEDLVQDALVKTFARGSAGAPRSAEAYVRRAILTTYIDGFRRRRRWEAVRHLFRPDDDAVGPEVHVTDRLDLLTALEALSPRQRACIVLRYYQDLTVPQIADALALSTGAVKRYLSDAVRRLEEILGPVADVPAEHLAIEETIEELDVTLTRKRSPR